MKAIKFFSITAILMMVVASMAFSFDGQFDMRCYACKALEVQKKSGCTGCRAWRMHELELKKKDKYEGYFVYHCEHGHELLVPKTDSRKLSDIKVWSPKDKDYVYLDDSYLEKFKLNGYE